MQILVYGAGVLGSLYASRLHAAGHQVTILARGKRLEDIRTKGIILEEAETGLRTITQLPVCARLDPDQAFDLAIVLVRKNQLGSVLPALAANPHIPNILIMVNSAAGAAECVRLLGAERVLLGFPGAGGQRVGATVRYLTVSGNFQATTLGELDGQFTARLAQISAAFRGAGFQVAVCADMDAWLKTHVALVSPLANAIYLAGGSNARLAQTRDGLVLLVRGIREGLRVLTVLNIPITPAWFRIFFYVPEPILVWLFRRILADPRVELVTAQHANTARDEMELLNAEFRALVDQTAIPTPALDQLATYLDPARPPMTTGRADLPLHRAGVWALLGAIGMAIFSLSLIKKALRRAR